MQIKLIFTRKVVRLASFWKWGFLELGSGLLSQSVNFLRPQYSSQSHTTVTVGSFVTDSNNSSHSQNTRQVVALVRVRTLVTITTLAMVTTVTTPVRVKARTLITVTTNEGVRTPLTVTKLVTVRTLVTVTGISDVIKKANKRMFFLILLKRTKVTARAIISFYHTCIRPLSEYCPPLYHHESPAYLSDDLERIQRRAFSIMSPGLPYVDKLTLYNMSSLKEGHIE